MAAASGSRALSADVPGTGLVFIVSGPGIEGGAIARLDGDTGIAGTDRRFHHQLPVPTSASKTRTIVAMRCGGVVMRGNPSGQALDHGPVCPRC